jgi:hypothetical protein
MTWQACAPALAFFQYEEFPTSPVGMNAFLLEYDPKSDSCKMAVDVMKTIDSQAKGFAAQAKIHTRNNVGASGKIYFGSKQGYPEKGEKRSDYPGGYIFTYDLETDRTEHFGIAKPHHGIISVMPDESRGMAYLSTCSDDRPIEHSHFMILDLKKRSYRDLGDMEHPYAFIVLDNKDRAYHPRRGGAIARYDPASDKLEILQVSVDKEKPPSALTKEDAVLNWDVAPDRKTLYAVEMSTNHLFAFDLTAPGDTIPGRNLGKLLSKGKTTDCRAMCVGPDGRLWAAVTEQGLADGPLLHLVSYKLGATAPIDHGPVGIANPDYTTFTTPDGKPKPWHHTVRTSKDGTLTPWVPMGVCAVEGGTAFVTTIAPFTLLRLTPDSLKSEN